MQESHSRLPRIPEVPSAPETAARPTPPNRNFRRGLTAGAVLLSAAALFVSTQGGEDDRPDRPEPSATEPAIAPTAESAPSIVPSPEVTPGRQEGLDDPIAQKRAAQVISTFENSKIKIKYDYAENINDGRGITAGRAGFCSGTGDMVLVVEKYTEAVPENPLAEYLPELRELREKWIDIGYKPVADVSGLEGLEAAWTETAQSDNKFIKAQDDVVNEVYLEPSQIWADKGNIRTTVGQLIVFDTIIQHGEGAAEGKNADKDGLPYIMNEVINKYPPSDYPEKEFLTNFLKIRKAHLENAADPDTRDAWGESVSRVDALQQILDANNPDLTGPMQWTVYGDSFSLDAVK